MNISSLRLESSPLAAPQRSFYGGTLRTTCGNSGTTCAGPHSLPLHNRKFPASAVNSVASSAASSPAVAGEPVSEALSRIGSLSQVSGVLGSQWGDEGKGKLVDILAKHFDIVARCQVHVQFIYLCSYSKFRCYLVNILYYDAYYNLIWPLVSFVTGTLPWLILRLCSVVEMLRGKYILKKSGVR